MSIRETEEYKNMTPYFATACAEGFEKSTKEEQLAAWQYISDTGIWRQLQGYFGRYVFSLLDDGTIEPPINRSV
jgi:hypothetical protein